MNSGVTDFLIGTAGTRASTGFSTSTVPAVRRASNTLPISAASSLVANLLLPACAATIFVVRLSSSGWLLSSSMLLTLPSPKAADSAADIVSS